MTAHINRETISDLGLVGALFTPADGALSAGVVVVGGSEGGMHEHDARVLADHGFAALSLAYFGAPGVPEVLKDVPLEYFSRAVDLLENRGIQAGSIGFLGGSRGGEAALLAASRDARIGAVVSVVGSGVVTQGIDFRLGRLDHILKEPTNAWCAGGRPLRFLPHTMSNQLADRITQGGTISLRDAYPALPVDPVELGEVSIPVELIRGAVLLISAGDDQMWDSVRLSQVAADRLHIHQHPYPWEHVVLESAGHAIAGPPGEPQTSTTTPGPGVTFELGGTPKRTTEARRAAWERSIVFLQEHLRVRTCRAMAVEIHPATVERFADLAQILAPRRRDAPACWCLYYRLTSSEYGSFKGEDRPNRLRAFCERENAPGVIAYVDGTPAGWCAFGPRTEMGRLQRSRTIPRIDDRPVWSIVCFVVRADFRRKGLTHQLLQSAIAYARSKNVQTLEAYPIEADGTRVSSAFAYAGTTSLFEAAGFRKIRETSARSGRLPRWIVRLDLSDTR